MDGTNPSSGCGGPALSGADSRGLRKGGQGIGSTNKSIRSSWATCPRVLPWVACMLSSPPHGPAPRLQASRALCAARSPLSKTTSALRNRFSRRAIDSREPWGELFQNERETNAQRHTRDMPRTFIQTLECIDHKQGANKCHNLHLKSLLCKSGITT